MRMHDRTWRRMAVSLFLLSAPLLSGPASAEPPSGDELLAAMDANLTFASRSSRLKMTVAGRRTRTYELVSLARGEEDAAIEYVAPARDKGTRMLKLSGELWIWLPSVDKVQKISGHMLRQGMMGSDLSYEDMMTSQQTRKLYRATVSGEEILDGRPCWKVELIAINDTVSYPKRITWVDRDTLIPGKQELYALSGMLLKTWTMTDVKDYGNGRRFPAKMEIRDHVKKDSITKLEFSDLKFDVELPKDRFTLRWLERR